MNSKISESREGSIDFQIEKRYKSRTLQKIINKYITESRYNEFKPLLDEIFQRRAYEFEYTLDEMERQIKTFTRTCKRIKIVKSLGEQTYANFVRATKEIHVSKRSIDENNKIKESDKSSKHMTYDEVGAELFASLTHEVYHAITARGKNVGLHILGKKEYVDNNGSAYVALNEAITEAAADKASYGRSRDDIKYGYRETNFYRYLTFIPQMFSQSLGVKENEFLKNGMSTLHNFKNYIGFQFSEDNEADINRLFEKFNISLDIYYKLLYFDNTGYSKEKIDDFLNRTSYEMFSVAADFLSIKISEESKPLSNKTIGEYLARISNLKSISVTQLEYVQALNTDTRDFRKDDEAYISISSLFQKNLSELMQKADIQLIECRNPEIADAYSQYNMMRRFNDFDDFRQYDNECVSRKTYDIVDTRLDSITLSIKQKVRKIKKQIKKVFTEGFNYPRLNEAPLTSLSSKMYSNEKYNSLIQNFTEAANGIDDEETENNLASYTSDGYEGNAFEYRYQYFPKEENMNPGIKGKNNAKENKKNIDKKENTNSKQNDISNKISTESKNKESDDKEI